MKTEPVADGALWTAEIGRRYLGISRGLFYRLLRDGVIPRVEITGKCVRVRPQDVLAYIETHTVSARPRR